MRLIALLGAHDALTPDMMETRALAQHWPDRSGRVVAPTARWISKRCGMFSHDFLLDAESERRTAEFARFIRASVAPDVALLLVFPHPAEKREALTAVLAALAEGIGAETVELAALVGPRHSILAEGTTETLLRRAAADLAARAGGRPVTQALRSADPDGELGRAVARNQLIHAVTEAMREHAGRVGLSVAETGAFARFEKTLRDRGLGLAPHISREQIGALVTRYM